MDFCDSKRNISQFIAQYNFVECRIIYDLNRGRNSSETNNTGKFVKFIFFHKRESNKILTM